MSEKYGFLCIMRDSKTKVTLQEIKTLSYTNIGVQYLITSNRLQRIADRQQTDIETEFFIF